MADSDNIEHLMLNVNELETMTVVQLKEHLKARGLMTSGTKPTLVKRLKDWATSAENQILGQGGDAAGIDLPLNDDAVLGLAPSEPTPSAPVTSKPTPPAPAAPKPVEKKPPVAPAAPTKPPAPAAAPVSKAKQPEPAKPAETTSAVVTNGEKAATVSLKKPVVSDEAAKRLERAKRFDVDVNAQDKKLLRAERFGTSNTSSASSITAKAVVSPEQLKKRAERFGLPVNTDTMATATADAKKQARADRFGTSTAANVTGTKRTSVSLETVKSTVTSDEVMEKRKARFGNVVADKEEVDSKKAKRAERFGL